MDCEFLDVCPELVTDEGFEPFPAVKFIPSSNHLRDCVASAVSNALQLLKNPSTEEFMRAHNMSVHCSNQTYPANIIFFGGRWWIITSEWDLFNLTQAHIESPENWAFAKKTVAALENNFHGCHQAHYAPLFISDPVDLETPNFLPTPTGLQWWLVKKTDETERRYAPDAPVVTVLTCQTPPLPCLGQGEYFCQNEGTCNDDAGFCDCPDDFQGDRCELEAACYETHSPYDHNGVLKDLLDFAVVISATAPRFHKPMSGSHPVRTRAHVIMPLAFVNVLIIFWSRLLTSFSMFEQ